jgi:hypothetical protein
MIEVEGGGAVAELGRWAFEREEATEVSSGAADLHR